MRNRREFLRGMIVAAAALAPLTAIAVPLSPEQIAINLLNVCHRHGVELEIWWGYSLHIMRFRDNPQHLRGWHEIDDAYELTKSLRGRENFPKYTRYLAALTANGATLGPQGVRVQDLVAV